MNIRTELMEALIRQCVREVLDQVEERVDADGKPIDHSSDIGKDDNKKPKKIKAKWSPPTKFKVDIKKTSKINEEEQDQEKKPDAEPSDPTSQPEPPQGEEPAGNDPTAAEPAASPSGEPEQSPDAGQKPEPDDEPVTASVKGAVMVDPKDKSRLDPKPLASLKGQSDNNIERILHRIATSTAGSKAKVSIGAKRMAREFAKNPNLTVYFYFGKMDPESDEIFLMADKSLNIAKDDSVSPAEISGVPVTNQPAASYSARAWDEPEGEINPDSKYADWMTRGKRTIVAKPRHGYDDHDPQGLSEGAKSMIKGIVNQILDGKR